MIDDVLYLISESPEAHGIFAADVDEPERMVYCRVKSVSRYEYFRGLDNGLDLTYVFVLQDAIEYQGEKICEYHGDRHRIARTFVNPDGPIELTVERIKTDMIPPSPKEVPGNG